jgi:acid phosphatase (class A)
MPSKILLKASILLLAFAPFFAQAQDTKSSTPKLKKTPIFIDPSVLDLSLILPPPPAQDSSITKAELSEVHHLEQTRTPAQIAAAQYDDTHEDFFIYSSVLGPAFSADALPLTAVFSAHIRNDAGIVDNPIKDLYARPRPYNFDTTLHPICETNKGGSYPSGHSINGFLYAYALAQIIPEKRQQILARADDYAHNRVVCEAHYPTDLEASRRVAYTMFGYMLANPRFQKELAAAREETRHHLNLQ